MRVFRNDDNTIKIIILCQKSLFPYLVNNLAKFKARKISTNVVASRIFHFSFYRYYLKLNNNILSYKIIHILKLIFQN